MVHPVLEAVTNDVIERSKKTRDIDLARIDEAMQKGLIVLYWAAVI